MATLTHKPHICKRSYGGRPIWAIVYPQGYYQPSSVLHRDAMNFAHKKNLYEAPAIIGDFSFLMDIDYIARHSLPPTEAN
jgi:hypothetical protein